MSLLKFFLIKLIKKIPCKYILSCINLFTKVTLYKSIVNIKSLGFEIKVIYDIGAHKGKWSRDLNAQFPEMKFYLFEANDSHKKDLNKLPYWNHIGVLSNIEKDVYFYSNKNQTGDSYFKESTYAYQDTLAKKLKSQTLDSVIYNKKLPLPDFIKIDTQGSELDILNGAKNCLKNARMLLLECPIYPYNLGGPKLSDYVNYLLDFNFYPSRLIEIHDMAGMLVQIDILFMNEELMYKSNINFKKFYLK